MVFLIKAESDITRRQTFSSPWYIEQGFTVIKNSVYHLWDVFSCNTQMKSIFIKKLLALVSTFLDFFKTGCSFISLSLNFFESFKSSSSSSSSLLKSDIESMLKSLEFHLDFCVSPFGLRSRKMLIIKFLNYKNVDYSFLLLDCLLGSGPAIIAGGALVGEFSDVLETLSSKFLSE